MVREDSDGKYTSVSCSARLRRQNARRSRAIPTRRPPAAATKSWLKVGITESAVAPSMDGSTGTSRQPRTVRPSSAAISSMRRRVLATSSSPPGRNAVPTAYACGCGSSKSTTSRKNASGRPSRMPAPSPESGSAPVAPRCSRLRSAVIALATMSWLASPVRVATNATPQASCSWSPSYSPWGAGNACMGHPSRRRGTRTGPPGEAVRALSHASDAGDDIGPSIEKTTAR